MPNVVGTKGQIVIEKQLRDELGVEPGWAAVQRVENGSLVIRFRPPKHNDSLFGIFSEYAKAVPEVTNAELTEAAERGYVENYLRRYSSAVPGADGSESGEP